MVAGEEEAGAAVAAEARVQRVQVEGFHRRQAPRVRPAPARGRPHPVAKRLLHVRRARSRARAAARRPLHGPRPQTLGQARAVAKPLLHVRLRARSRVKAVARLLPRNPQARPAHRLDKPRLVQVAPRRNRAPHQRSGRRPAQEPGTSQPAAAQVLVKSTISSTHLVPPPAQQAGRAPHEEAARPPISCKAEELQSRRAPSVARAVAANRRVDAGRPGTAGENVSQNHPQRIENRGERQGERDTRRDEVVNQYNENNPGSFWEENPGWSALRDYASLRVGRLGFGRKLDRLQRRTHVVQLR